MQIFQSTNNQNTFKFNGLAYPKNFMVIKQGAENIAIHNAYDTRHQLLGSTNFSQIQVNGIIYTSQGELMAALSNLLFAKAFNYVVQDIDATRLISVGEITVDTNYVTVEPVEWIIDGMNFETTSNTVLTVPYTSSGKTRIDLIVVNSLNQIIRIEGVETTGIATAPITPIDTVYLSQINVNDNIIGTPSTPITGNLYLKKEEFAENNVISDEQINLNLTNDSTAFRIFGTVSHIIGFTATSNFLNNNLYTGKEVKIVNNQETPIILKHNQNDGIIPFIFPNQSDLILNANEVVIFKLTKTDTLIAEFISINRLATTTPEFSGEFLSLSGGTVSGTTDFSDGLSTNNFNGYDDNGFLTITGSYFEMFANDGSYLNLSNGGLSINDSSSNASNLNHNYLLFNSYPNFESELSAANLIIKTTDNSLNTKYCLNNITNNDIIYQLPTGSTSQIATKLDILNSVSGLTGNTLQTITNNGNVTTNNLIVNVVGVGQSRVSASDFLTTNGSQTTTITPNNINIQNSLSGISTTTSVDGYFINSTSISTNYGLNNITNNGIEYALPTGSTSQIATKLDIQTKWQGIDDVNSGNGVSGTTIETLDKTYHLLPNTLVDGHLDFSIYSIRESGSSLAHQVVVKVGSTNVFSASTLLFSANTSGNFSPHLRTQRKFVLKDNLIKDANLTSNANIGAAATGIAVPFNLSNDIYIFFSVIPGAANQVIKFDGIQIKQL